MSRISSWFFKRTGTRRVLTILPKRYFSVILQPRNFHNVKFTDNSSAGKTVRKITKILHPLGPKLKFESFKSVKYSRCYESV